VKDTDFVQIMPHFSVVFLLQYHLLMPLSDNALLVKVADYVIGRAFNCNVKDTDFVQIMPHFSVVFLLQYHLLMPLSDNALL
ncbi:hypothetical protein, partial [Salmonella enterica]|uniref:hypothetical protein n=1 Tax=Salmonella enterica TaxID=28901 RepID=UPI002EAD9EB9|nr:hypothetical protein [Salmonella enterica subsp. enterica serovar Paratyphi A]